MRNISYSFLSNFTLTLNYFMLNYINKEMVNMSKLKDKIAIITGGASGIGKGIATAFVKAGATVAIVDLNEEVGNTTIKELQTHQPNSIVIQATLAEHDQLTGIVQQVTDKFSKLDILVNNAHASRMNAFEQTTKADLDLSFNTGFYPTFYLMQAALPYLKESEGKIINFASGAGINGDANQASYAAAKEAIR